MKSLRIFVIDDVCISVITNNGYHLWIMKMIWLYEWFVYLGTCFWFCLLNCGSQLHYIAAMPLKWLPPRRGEGFECKDLIIKMLREILMTSLRGRSTLRSHTEHVNGLKKLFASEDRRLWCISCTSNLRLGLVLDSLKLSSEFKIYGVIVILSYYVL